MKVTAISNRGKQLIKEHGDEWEVVKTAVMAQCLNNKAGVLIGPVDSLGSFNRWEFEDSTLRKHLTWECE